MVYKPQPSTRALHRALTVGLRHAKARFAHASFIASFEALYNADESNIKIIFREIFNYSVFSIYVINRRF